MRLLDIILAPWAIRPGSLLEIRDLYQAHTRREKLDIKAWEAATGQRLGSEPQPYRVVKGVGIVDVMGVLTKNPSVWNRLCGMSSMKQIGQAFQKAVKDPKVHSIILRVDSPGGMVDGTQELASAIYGARGTKPITALADGQMCSAAYWVGAAADKVYAVSDTTAVGSIGVVATHQDVSGMESKDGIKTTEITAGKYKRIASSYAPLSEEGRATIQAQVDYIYSVFVDSISMFRGVPVEKVLEQMADGRIFLGQQAVSAGLVDGVSTLDALIREMGQKNDAHIEGMGQESSAVMARGRDARPQFNHIPSFEELEDQAPEIFAAIKAEGYKEGVKAGASAEKERIKGVFAQGIPSHKALIEGMAFDGKTSPGEAAMAVNAAMRTRRASPIDKIRSATTASSLARLRVKG